MAGLPALFCSRKVRLCDIRMPCSNRSNTAMTPTAPSEPAGSWDSIHVFEAVERGRQAHYKLTSTIMLQLVTHKGGPVEHVSEGVSGTKGKDGWKKEGETTLSGSMTRQVRLSTSVYHKLTPLEDRARLAIARCFIPHYEHWEDDRRDGDQNA